MIALEYVNLARLNFISQNSLHDMFAMEVEHKGYVL